MNKVSRDVTAAVIDGLIKFIAAGGIVTTALLAPNVVQIFDKPLSKLLYNLDHRSRERELRRIAYHMKRQGLVTYTARDYEHGMKLTKAGKKRLKNMAFKSLSITPPDKWDKKWRLVFFDIPESNRRQRGCLTAGLKRLGFQQLQKSIWIHPFSCRQEVEVLTEYHMVRKYVSYVEISHIDSESDLKLRFTSTFRYLKNFLHKI